MDLIPTSTAAVVGALCGAIITLAGALVGLSAWARKKMSEQLARHEKSVIEIHRENQLNTNAVITAFRAEMASREERHDRELARRDKAFERVAAAFEGVANEIRELRGAIRGHPRRPDPE